MLMGQSAAVSLSSIILNQTILFINYLYNTGWSFICQYMNLSYYNQIKLCLIKIMHMYSTIYLN